MYFYFTVIIVSGNFFTLLCTLIILISHLNRLQRRPKQALFLDLGTHYSSLSKQLLGKTKWGLEIRESRWMFYEKDLVICALPIILLKAFNESGKLLWFSFEILLCIWEIGFLPLVFYADLNNGYDKSPQVCSLKP